MHQVSEESAGNSSMSDLDSSCARTTTIHKVASFRTLNVNKLTEYSRTIWKRTERFYRRLQGRNTARIAKKHIEINEG